MKKNTETADHWWRAKSFITFDSIKKNAKKVIVVLKETQLKTHFVEENNALIIISYYIYKNILFGLIKL